MKYLSKSKAFLSAWQVIMIRGSYFVTVFSVIRHVCNTQFMISSENLCQALPYLMFSKKVNLANFFLIIKVIYSYL